VIGILNLILDFYENKLDLIPNPIRLNSLIMWSSWINW